MVILWVLQGNVPPWEARRSRVGACFAVHRLCVSILITENSGASVFLSAKWGYWYPSPRAEVRHKETCTRI